MSKIDDGGPAFPNVPDGAGDKWDDWDKGMTLRDYMAAKAMQGMLADLPKTCYGLDWTEKTAAAAFQMADAMLRARGVKA